MTSEAKLPRWTEDADVPDELRDLLRANRAQLGTQGEVAELMQSVSRALGPEAGLTGAAAAIKAPMAAFRWGAWLAGGVVSAVVIWSMTRGTPPPSSINPPRPALTESPATHAVDAVRPLTTPAPAAGQAAASHPEPAPAAEPPVAAEAATPPVRRQRSKATAPGLSESELLRQAQALLSEDPSRSLALTREHGRRFQAGALAQEREVIAIEALKRLGRERAASERAAAFEQRYRGSVHQSRVRRPAAED